MNFSQVRIAREKFICSLHGSLKLPIHECCGQDRHEHMNKSQPIPSQLEENITTLEQQKN